MLYNQPEENNCHYCEKPLFGRTDKKFCNDTCRNAYNRRRQQVIKTQISPRIEPVIRTLKKNFELLERINTYQAFPTTFSRHKLLDMGFNFKFFTTIRPQKDGSNYYFCFEYGWKELGEDKVVLVWNHEQAEL